MKVFHGTENTEKQSVSTSLTQVLIIPVYSTQGTRGKYLQVAKNPLKLSLQNGPSKEQGKTYVTYWTHTLLPPGPSLCTALGFSSLIHYFIPAQQVSIRQIKALENSSKEMEK